MAGTAPTTEELLEHTEWLTRLARALVGDSGAGDVVQDTYEAALARPGRREGPLRPWLGGVARNVVRMATRRRVRREQREEAVPVHDEVPSPEQLVARAQLQQQINRVVIELHEPLRSTLLLRFFEGLSAAEIARAQGIPAATVRSRLKDALDRVRAALDAEHANDRRAWVGLLAPLAVWPQGTGVATGGLIVSTFMKTLIALLVAALVIFGTRLAGLWGHSPPEKPVAVAKVTAATSAPAAPALVGEATPRDPLTIHDRDPKGTLRVEGQVIDEHDAPVAHATVAIDANPPIVVKTETDGSFVFDGLLRRDYRIEATAGDRYAGPARLRLSDKPEPVTLRMRKGGSVEVTVTDRASGAPVAGAEVELRSWLSTLTWKATTNGQGVALLAGIGAGSSPLVVRANGYAQAAQMLGTSGEPATVEHAAVSLVRGTAVSGRVVDDKGAPVANARVLAANASEPLPVVDPYRDAVVTGPDGTFTIGTLSAGTWRLTASSGDYAPTTSPAFALDGQHARSGIELRLAAGAVVHGIVKDPSGDGVPAAVVSVVPRGYVPWLSRRQTFTDASGAFSIGGLEARAVDVVAWHDSGSSAIVSADLAAKRDQTVTLTLDVTGAITGTVVDNKGQPIADAQVTADADEHGDPAQRTAWMVRGVQETTTDQGGSFRFAGLPSGEYRVRAARPSATDAALWLSPGVAATPNGAPIQVVVPADGRATGKVVFDDGKPATAFTVRIEDTRPLAFVGKDGAFAVPAVAGTYTLTVDGPGFVSTGKQVTIAEGKDSDVGSITVHPGRSVSGRVLDDHGSPVAKATVAAGALLTGGGADLYIKSESIGAKDTETDAQGHFELDGFPPSPLTIVAGKPNAGRSTSVQLPATSDSATLDLVLGPTASLAGKVTRGGQPLADTVVIANPVGAMASNFFVTTGPDGTFALDALTPGAYLVYPMIGGGGNAPKDMYMRRVEVAAGGKTTTELDASPGPVTLDVSVKTDKGAPVPMAGLLAIELTIDIDSIEQLRDGTRFPMTDTAIPMHMRMVMAGGAEIANMRPGAYTMCALLGDPRMGDPPKKCTHVALTNAAKQTAEIVVPDALLHH